MQDDYGSASDVLDSGNYPDINFVSFCDAYRIGPAARFVLWDWVKVGGIMRRNVVATITRRSFVDLPKDQMRAQYLLARPSMQEMPQALAQMHH